MAIYVVQPGDTITSIAYARGFFPETLWLLDENAALRERRGNPDILLAGDEVFVPEKRIAHLPAATGKRHVFRLRGVPAKTRIQLFRGPAVRANEPFTITIDGRAVEGTSDADGIIEAFIPPDAKRGELVIGSDDRQSFTINFGELDPIAEASGVLQRLRNLGLVDADEKLDVALRRLQRMCGIAESGEADAATLDALVQMHDHPSSPPDASATHDR